jgi:hypothetical protein
MEVAIEVIIKHPSVKDERQSGEITYSIWRQKLEDKH